MKIVGHRGAAGLAPENTLLSIKKALEFDVDAVEFDVRVTKDRKLVLLHDSDLKRICDNTAKVKDLTLAQLRKIPTISGEPIPTLKEALELLENKTVFLEPKDGDILEELDGATKNSKADIRYTTRQHKLLTGLKLKRPELKIYPTNDWAWRSLAGQIRRLGADGLSINYSLLNPLTFWQIKKLNIEMLVFTVDEPNQIEKAARLFKDAWLCTNRPDIARSLLKK